MVCLLIVSMLNQLIKNQTKSCGLIVSVIAHRGFYLPGSQPVVCNVCLYLHRQVANFTVMPEHDEVVFECRLSFEKENDNEDDAPTYTDQCATFFYVNRKFFLFDGYKTLI